MTAERIRDLNDAFRRSFAGGKVMTTAGIAAMTDDTRAEVFDRVRAFEAFTAENDPHGEHDFGNFAVDGRKLFWKIDLYEEPGVKGADGLPLTTRVLTIMLAEEW
jgi:Protein of unknown function (DUF3768)